MSSNENKSGKCNCFLTNSDFVTDWHLRQVFEAFSQLEVDVFSIRRLGRDAVNFKVTGVKGRKFAELEKSALVDINFLYNPSPKKLLFADMDSTIIKVECIDELADFFGIREQVESITKRSMIGEIDFSESLKKRVALLKGLDMSQMIDCFKNKVEISQGACTLVKTMKAFGAEAYLVSGGFTFFTDRVASLVGFNDSFANRLVFEKGTLSGEIEEPILDEKSKSVILQRLCRARSVDSEDTLAVGDGANDVKMIKEAGLGVSYYGKQPLEKVSDMQIKFSDLRSLLYFQGLEEKQFIQG